MASTQLADYRCEGVQQCLWDWADDVVFSSPHHASPYVGEWAEEYVAQLWQGRRLETQAFRMCPDVELAKGVFAEVKAVSPRRCFTMYKGRYDAYKQWMKETGHQLYFVLVLHDCRASSFKTRNHMRGLLRNNVDHVIVVRHQAVFREVDRQIKEHGGWRHAPGRAKGYQDYVILSPNWIRAMEKAKPYRPKRTFPVEVHGDRIGHVPFRTYKCPIPGEPLVGWHPPFRCEAAQQLLDELDNGWLEWGKSAPISDTDPRRRRVKESVNAEWYQKFCAEYLSDRKLNDTIITRRTTRRVLERIAANKPIGSTYEERLLPFLEAKEREFLDTEDSPF